MTWANVDDLFPEHPKVIAAGGDAAWLYICGLCFTNRNLTEGRIPKAVVPRLSDRKNPMKLATVLVNVGLWHDQGTHYVINDWEKYNEDAETVKARKEQARKAAQVRWTKKNPPAVDAQSNAVSNARSNAHSIQSAHAESANQQCPPTPLLLSTSSSSNHQGGGMPISEEEESRKTAMTAALVVARRRLDVRDGPPITDPAAWLRKTAKSIYDEHGAELRAGACNGDSVEAMADRLMPRSGPTAYAEPLAGEFVEVLDEEGNLLEAKWVAAS